jgi:hypothetical protein
LFTSEDVSVHCPEQVISPLLHAQVPPWQTCPPLHGWLHAPQLEVLVARLTQLLEQSVVPLPHPLPALSAVPVSVPELEPDSGLDPVPESAPPFCVVGGASGPPASETSGLLVFADVGGLEEHPANSPPQTTPTAATADARPRDERMN